MATDPTFIEQLKKIELTPKRRVSANYAGSRQSIRQGRGIEVVDYREYYPGDDYRTIDWRVYARTEKLYIKRFEEEKELVTHILVDSSASMDFYGKGMRKFDYAASLAAGFAYLAASRYEKFACALFSERLNEVLQPKKGKNHFFNLASILNNAEQKSKTDIGKCISQYSKLIKSRSFIVLLSDFLQPIDSLESAIYRAAKYSKEAILVQVLDPAELDLSWREDIDFEDMEETKNIRTFLSPDFRKRYKDSLTEHINNIKDICESAGVKFFPIRTDHALFDSFIEIVR